MTTTKQAAIGFGAYVLGLATLSDLALSWRVPVIAGALLVIAWGQRKPDMWWWR